MRLISLGLPGCSYNTSYMYIYKVGHCSVLPLSSTVGCVSQFGKISWFYRVLIIHHIHTCIRQVLVVLISQYNMVSQFYTHVHAYEHEITHYTCVHRFSLILILKSWSQVYLHILTYICTFLRISIAHLCIFTCIQ